MRLVPMVDREESSRHRRYRPEHIHWIQFLRALRSAGMPIREMREYAKLAVGGDASWPERRAMLASHRERVLASIEALSEHLAILDDKLAHGCDPARHARPGRARQNQPRRRRTRTP